MFAAPLSPAKKIFLCFSALPVFSSAGFPAEMCRNFFRFWKFSGTSKMQKQKTFVLALCALMHSKFYKFKKAGANRPGSIVPFFPHFVNLLQADPHHYIFIFIVLFSFRPVVFRLDVGPAGAIPQQVPCLVFSCVDHSVRRFCETANITFF